MTRCPVCRARLGEAPQCRRCGCDLGRAQACRRRAHRLLHQALESLRQGNIAGARAQAAEAMVFDASEPVRRIVAFVLWFVDNEQSSRTASLQVDPAINRLQLP